MLRDALFLASKDLRHMFRARETWLWAFLMPIVFFYFIGAVTGGFSSSPTIKPTIAVYAPLNGGFLADHLVRSLEARNYSVAKLPSPDALKRFRLQLAIPDDFTASVLAGKPVEVKLTRSGDGLGADYDRIRVMRAVYGVLADLIVAGKDGGKPTPEALGKLAAQPRLLTLKVESGGKRRAIPSGFEQSVPGILVMFVMLVLFTTGGVTLTLERNQGILRRLASAPISRSAVVAGKWGARMGLGLIQIAFAMVTGTVLFGMRWGTALPAVLVVLFIYAALASAVGILLGNAARTEGQVIGIGVIASNVLAALGGCWWPIEITPAWAQKFALFLPTGWAMDALHKLVNFGEGPSAVIPHLVAMTLATLVAGYLTARRFRFQ